MSPLAVGVVIGIGGAVLIGTDAVASSAPSSALGSSVSVLDTPLDHDLPVTDTPTLTYAGDGDRNMEAMLAVIRKAESNNDYYALVGGGRIDNLDCHPSFTDASMTQKSAYGRGPGWRDSHAAGAYQFQPQTWRECVQALKLDGSFSEDNQDRAAAYLIQRRGGTNAVRMGDIDGAVAFLRKEWQFFTVSQWPSTRVASTFENYGGTVA